MTNTIVECPTIDRGLLRIRGWAPFQVLARDESDMLWRLLQLAGALGTPAPTRHNGSLHDVLSPTEAKRARQCSLSRRYDVGEFPLHMDTAHWLLPCRYIMLACVSPGSGGRATLLMDTQQLPLAERQTLLLRVTPMRVTNGRASFFSNILSKSRPFVRFDPGCMTATSPNGAEALGILSRHNWPNYVEKFHWELGVGIIIDNWRMLHGRENADVSDADRKLIRILIR